MIVSLSFALGALLSQYVLPVSAHLWAAGAGAVLFFSGRVLRGRRGLGLSLIGAALAVSLLYCWGFRTYLGRETARLTAQEQQLTLRVAGYAQKTGRMVRIAVDIEGVDFVRDRGMYYGDESLYDLEPGDRITGVMEVTDAAVVGDDPITSFTAKGTWYLLFSAGDVSYETGESTLRDLPARLARSLLDEIEERYDQPYAGLMSALLLGERTELDEGISSDLSEAGVYHITAVSGLHCGFFLGLVAFFVGRHRQRLLAGLAIPLLLLYTLAAGCPASMVRSSVMLSLVLLGPLLGRESDPMTSLSFALMVLLIGNPLSIGGVGLQLSFGAMAGLILLTPRIYALFPKCTNRFARAGLYTLSASLGCMAFTAPLTALYFNFLPLVGPVVNVLVLWSVSLTFMAGILSVTIGAWIAPVGAVLALMAKGGLAYLAAVTRWAAGIPYHAVYFTNPYLAYWLAYALLLFGYCALTPKSRRKYVVASALAVCTLAVVVYLPIRQRQGTLHAAAIDVGQGACTLLASGGETVMVDCGSNNSYIDAGSQAADALNTYGYFYLDTLVLTHYHDDHANGLAVLLARMPVEEIWAPLPTEEEQMLHDQAVELAERYGVEIQYVTEDTALDFGTGTLTLFAPVGSGTTNEEGISVLCTVEDFDLLITGDMNAAHERKLAAGHDLPDIEVLMVGHHGSKNATSRELLEAVTPEVGIISVGDNSYGHPDDGAIQRMVRLGMKIYRTDLQGTVSLVFGKENGNGGDA